MKLLSSVVKKYRTIGEGQFVYRLCGATFEDPIIVLCPKCRGLVTKRPT